MKHARSTGGSSMMAGPLLAPRVIVPLGAANLRAFGLPLILSGNRFFSVGQ
jgi:hypothetical protein